jgi:hypothetical protein
MFCLASVKADARIFKYVHVLEYSEEAVYNGYQEKPTPR